MILLYKYIFYRAYSFNARLFTGKGTLQWFAYAVMTVIFVANIMVVIDSVLYFTNPEMINSIFVYYKYLAFGVLLIATSYLDYKNRYKKILLFCEKLSKKKESFLIVVSIIYVSVLFSLFFYLSDLMREYNSSPAGAHL